MRNPKGKHLPKASAKDNRQYSHILSSEMKRGRSKPVAKRIAAATVRKGQKQRRRNTSAFDYLLRKVKERSVEDIGGRARMIEIIAGDLSWEDHTPIQAQRELIKAGMSRKSAGAFVRKAQTFNRLAARRNPVEFIVKYFVASGWKWGIPKEGGGWSYSKETYQSRTAAIKAAKAQTGGKLRTARPYKKPNPPAKSKAGKALKTTGRALQGATRGILAAGSQILGAGAAALNPRKRKPAKRKNKTIIKAKRVTVVAPNGRKRAVKKTVKRRRNQSPESIRKEFAGSVSGSRDLYFPQGTPTGLAKLGKLVSIKTEEGTLKPVSGTAWLCADTHGHLHIGCTQNKPLWDGKAHSFGQVKEVEYEAAKPHLGYQNPITFFHKMGEESGRRPKLRADGKGGLKFIGGAYRITREGIVN